MDGWIMASLESLGNAWSWAKGEVTERRDGEPEWTKINTAGGDVTELKRTKAIKCSIHFNAPVI